MNRGVCVCVCAYLSIYLSICACVPVCVRPCAWKRRRVLTQTRSGVNPISITATAVDNYSTSSD